LNGSEKSNEKTSSGKLIYFEIKKNIRIAQAAENKFKSLTRNKLIEMIRKSNPELLDLKNTLNQNDHLKELVY
jgi:predicted GIY-YIG superfamily endonuclease